METIRCVDCTGERATLCTTNIDIARSAIAASVEHALNGSWIQLDPTTGQPIGPASTELVLEGQSVLHGMFIENLQAKQHDIGCSLDETEIEVKLSTTQGK